MTSFAAIPLSPSQPHQSLQPDERPYETRGLASPDRPQHHHSYPSASYSRSRSYPSPEQARYCAETLQSRGEQSTPRSPPLSRSPHLLRPAIHTRPSFIDEILPTPSSGVFSSEKMRGLPITSTDNGGHHDHSPASSARESRTEFVRLLRRSGSIGVIFCFLLMASWMAATDTGGNLSVGLRDALGAGKLGVQEISMDAIKLGQGGNSAPKYEQGQEGAHGHGHGLGYGQVETDDDMEAEKSKPDYDQYIMLRTLPSDMVSTSTQNKRVIIIGDIHGSYLPLQNLLQKLSYSPTHDTLLHVGDLLAKGPLPNEVLNFMDDHNVYGVRGNHDQPVVRWRAWMEHAGGLGWREMMDQVGKQSEKDAREYFDKKGKGWPGKWEWRGEHWKIARSLTDKQYAYLLTLPLALHIPSLHSVIVHAGIVPYDLNKSPNDASQPLIIADRASLESQDLNVSLGAPSNDDDGAENTDWSSYADDDSDVPEQGQSASNDGAEDGDAGQDDPWAELDKELSGSAGPGEAWHDDAPSGSTDAHGHGRPASLDRPVGGAPGAHGHGHIRALNVRRSTDGNRDRNGSHNLARKDRSPRADDIRLSTELSILTSLPQNIAPYTLTEMRSLYTHGKKRGRITKSSKKGTHWGKVWNGQMERCRGEGALSGEAEEELGDVWGRAEGVDEQEGEGVEVDGRKLRCSPFTVIYGHAAGRGLDIRPFSKGIDTGCVYGQQLTALVLGDTKGLSGKSVKVDEHKGVLVSVDCKSGGTA